jgi:SAM-dependent methyltransferase
MTRLKGDPTPPASLFRFGVLLKLISQIPQNAIICDVGSGPNGGILPFIPAQCLKVAVDPIFRLIPCSKATSGKFVPVVGVGENLGFKNGTFDFAFCVNMLDHSAMPEKLLDNICNVLKSEGIVMLMVHVVTPVEKLAYLVFRFARHRLRKSSIVSLSKNLIDFFSQRLFGLSIATDSYLHPFYFTVKEFTSLARRKGFIILYGAIDVSRFGFKDELFMILTKSD